TAPPRVDTNPAEHDTFRIQAPMRNPAKFIVERPLVAGALAAAWVAALAAGWAGAQSGGAPPAAVAAPRGGPEQIAEAQRALSKGKAAAQRLQGLVDEARRERDLIRMTCLSDKLAQYNA